MASLVGKALALRNLSSPPVPMGDGGGPMVLPAGLRGAGADEARMRSFSTNGTVNANVGLLASSTAAPVWNLYSKQPVDGRVRYTTNDQGSDQRKQVVKHQALTVLAKPASMLIDGYEVNFWTQTSLFEISQIWLDTTGKSHWITDFDPRAKFPVGLWPVRPDRMIPVPSAKGFLAGWIYTAPDGREKIPLRPWEVIYNKYPDPLDVYGGTGPIGSVLTDIEASRYAAEYNRNYFLNSAIPGGVLQADHELEDEEFNRLTNRWREAHKGVSRAHRIAVLEAGITWVPTHTSMKDMDFAALRLSSRDVIREALRMHKVMTGVTDDVNRANAQTGEEVFASWQIKPRLERWRDVLNNQFLPLFGSAGTDVEFDFVLPTPQNREQDNLELKTKSEAALSLVEAGYDQRDVLEAVGLPDMKTALRLADVPALPPRWTVATEPAEPAAPAEPDAEGEPATAPGGKPKAQPAAQLALAPFTPALPVNQRDPASKVFELAAKDYPAAAMAWMHHATWTGPAKVPTDHIEPDMKWMDGADPDHVADFVKLLKAGKKLKPVILVKTPGNPKTQLIDGHHRYLACAEMGLPVRSFIGKVTEDHGDWETMHDYQSEDDDSAKNRLRDMAIWNSLAGAR